MNTEYLLGVVLALFFFQCIFVGLLIIKYDNIKKEIRKLHEKKIYVSDVFIHLFDNGTGAEQVISLSAYLRLLREHLGLRISVNRTWTSFINAKEGQ